MASPLISGGRGTFIGNPALNWTMDMEEELMINERVEAQDLKDFKNVMGNRLQEFREEWNELKHLRIQAENEQE
jgi:hypothetical protein